jgi:hypothetical protein
VTRFRDTIIDVVGNALKRCSEQIGATAVNVGVMFGLTVMLMSLLLHTVLLLV